MPENTNKPNEVNENLGQSEMDQQLQSHATPADNDQKDNPMTHGSDDDANEASAARHAIDKGGNDSALKYTDRNRRTTTRANEATDRNDSGSGGLGAGGGHSAGEIM